jgi:hypothetical protein
MTVDDLAELIGTDLFRRACDIAWATAAETGRGRGTRWPTELADVTHELSDLIDGDGVLGFALYRAMPCYAVLMQVGFEPHDEAFWAEMRSLLDDTDDRLAAPAAYWLWCGPLESAAEVATAWREVTAQASDRRLRRALDISGPVPWALKEELLFRLSRQDLWRRPVLGALVNAAFDSFGDVDPAAAGKVLHRLGLPDNETAELRDRLRRR